jgi:hypothetical protein
MATVALSLWCSPSPNTTTSHPQREAVNEAPPSPASHADSEPAKQQDAAPRKSLAQLDRIALCKSAHLIRIKYAVTMWEREDFPAHWWPSATNQPNTCAYCQGPASWCGLCAVAARSIKNALMLKQGRQISRKRSSQSNSLADGRVYDRLEEETSQPPYLPLSFSRPDLGVCRDRTVVFGQNGSQGRVGRHAFSFSLGTCWERARADDYATTTANRPLEAYYITTTYLFRDISKSHVWATEPKRRPRQQRRCSINCGVRFDEE